MGQGTFFYGNVPFEHTQRRDTPEQNQSSAQNKLGNGHAFLLRLEPIITQTKIIGKGKRKARILYFLEDILLESAWIYPNKNTVWVIDKITTGFSQSRVMERIKKIYDSIHRFIRIDPLEKEFILSAPFRRLHHIHQLGIAYFVYPGGTHRRFEHSLGVMETASKMYDAVAKDPYWRQIIRFAALAHDLGHLPFSHAAEKMIPGYPGHEIWSAKIIESDYLLPIWEKLQKRFPEKEVREDVLKIALGETTFNLLRGQRGNVPFSPWERVMSDLITGDFFGADRIDYLIRDARCTGLAYGFFDYDQLLDTLRIFYVKNIPLLGVEEGGLASCEALLLARHYMHKRLYQYSGVESYAFHLSRCMRRMYTDIFAPSCQGSSQKALDAYLAVTDNEVMTDIRRAVHEPDHPAHVDSFRLMSKKDRFEAIPFVADTTAETKLVEMRRKLSVPEEDMAWRVHSSSAQSRNFDFPVLSQDGSVETGTRLSSLRISVTERSWVYVAPSYQHPVRRYLRERFTDLSA